MVENPKSFKPVGFLSPVRLEFCESRYRISDSHSTQGQARRQAQVATAKIEAMQT